MATVLAVDDTPPSLALACVLLRNAGHDVIEATCAEDGVALARARKPDLILMDLHLPGMNGLEATKLLKAHPATAAIKVLIMTSYADEFGEDVLIAAGAELVLRKPLNHVAFAAAVTAALGGSRAVLPE